MTDENISEAKTKQGLRLMAQKRIYSSDIIALHNSFCKLHPSIQASITTYFRCKPFYILPATDREMEGCGCIKCLNPHLLYNAIKRHIDGLPHSLTNYFSDLFSCSFDHDINYPSLQCINGTCENSCVIQNESSKKHNWDEMVSFSQFERITEKFFDRNGKEKYYTRTARRDHNGNERVSLREHYTCLQDSARPYLLHRYNVSCDKVHWRKFVAESDKCILWLDYSQNIQLTPKNNVQSAYYSGKQHTLHDALIQKPNGECIYVYHLSDDTNHDSVMTDVIINDIIKNHPELIKFGILIIRSDNCSTQYKLRYIFGFMLKLARKLNISIYWFYGEAGHGRVHLEKASSN